MSAATLATYAAARVETPRRASMGSLRRVCVVPRAAHHRAVVVSIGAEGVWDRMSGTMRSRGVCVKVVTQRVLARALTRARIPAHTCASTT